MRSPEDTARAVAAALALVLAAGIATVGARLGDEQAPPAVTAVPADGSPAPDASPEPDVSPAPDVLAALDRRIRPLGGDTQRLDDAASGLGPLDADGVLALTGTGGADPDAAARGLEELGFQQAVGRGWSSRYGRVFVVVASRFATPEGAESRVEGLRSRLPGLTDVSRAVPAAVVSVARPEGRLERHAAFSRGPYAYEVTYRSPYEDEDDSIFEYLLGEQASHVEALDP